jgi:hypothetical protein
MAKKPKNKVYTKIDLLDINQVEALFKDYDKEAYWGKISNNYLKNMQKLFPDHDVLEIEATGEDIQAALGKMKWPGRSTEKSAGKNLGRFLEKLLDQNISVRREISDFDYKRRRTKKIPGFVTYYKTNRGNHIIDTIENLKKTGSIQISQAFKEKRGAVEKAKAARIANQYFTIDLSSKESLLAAFRGIGREALGNRLLENYDDYLGEQKRFDASELRTVKIEGKAAREMARVFYRFSNRGRDMSDKGKILETMISGILNKDIIGTKRDPDYVPPAPAESTEPSELVPDPKATENPEKEDPKTEAAKKANKNTPSTKPENAPPTEEKKGMKVNQGTMLGSLVVAAATGVGLTFFDKKPEPEINEETGEVTHAKPNWVKRTIGIVALGLALIGGVQVARGARSWSDLVSADAGNSKRER